MCLLLAVFLLLLCCGQCFHSFDFLCVLQTMFQLFWFSLSFTSSSCLWKAWSSLNTHVKMPSPVCSETEFSLVSPNKHCASSSSTADNPSLSPLDRNVSTLFKSAQLMFAVMLDANDKFSARPCLQLCSEFPQLHCLGIKETLGCIGFQSATRQSLNYQTKTNKRMFTTVPEQHQLLLDF